jgi:steroid delta-isomerase-like uncharacterized protein
MSIEENKELIRRYVEAGNSIQGDVSKVRALAEEFLAPGFVAHHSMAGDMNAEQFITTYEMFFTAFPDLKYTIVNMIAEEDKVVLQSTASGTHKGTFQGIPPTGKLINVSAVGVYRIAGGKFVENWGLTDSLGLMQQLGIIPKR